MYRRSPKLEFSPSRQVRHGITPRPLGSAGLGAKGFRYRLPAATHDQRIGRSPKIWADWSGTLSSLEGPFFISSALALPPLPHPRFLRIFRQALALVLCSSVFLCVDGFFLLRGSFFGRPGTHHSPHIFLLFACPWRAGAAAWWVHARR